MTLLKPKRIVDKNLLEVIRNLPCSACGKRAPSDPAHVKSRGSGGPDSAFNVIPLCRQHHSEQHASGFLNMIKKYPRFYLYLKSLGWQISVSGLWHDDLSPH